MKVLVVIAFVAIVAVYAKPNSRQKRQAYELPDGSQFLLGPVRTTFQCRQDGYYADVDNNCQIFHICNTANHADGTQEIQHYSFFCGNQTVFNQLTLNCAYPEEAIPCQNAPDFFYLNGKLGVENALFHDEADIQRAAPLLAANRGAPSRG